MTNAVALYLSLTMLCAPCPWWIIGVECTAVCHAAGYSLYVPFVSR